MNPLKFFYLYVEFRWIKGLQSENVDVIASSFSEAIEIYRHTLMPIGSKLCYVKERMWFFS